MDASQTLNRSDRCSFKQQSQTEDGPVQRQPPLIRWARISIGKGPTASKALVTLRAVPIATEATGKRLAKWAKHSKPPFFLSAAQLE